MRNRGENLPATRADASEDLTPEFTYDELLAEMLASLEPIEPRHKGEYTIGELALSYRLGWVQMNRKAKKMVDAGIWAKRETVIDGRHTSVYWKVK